MSETGAACMYCLESVETLKMPCMLPCSHIGCIPCLKTDLSRHGKIVCPCCRFALHFVKLIVTLLFAVLSCLSLPSAPFPPPLRLSLPPPIHPSIPLSHPLSPSYSLPLLSVSLPLPHFPSYALLPTLHCSLPSTLSLILSPSHSLIDTLSLPLSSSSSYAFASLFFPPGVSIPFSQRVCAICVRDPAN